MKRKWAIEDERFFGIGVYRPKTEVNIGTLWRTAHIFGASFIFVIDKRYKRQASDTEKTWSRIPLFQYTDFDHFYDSLPYSCQLVGIELDKRSTKIEEFHHPQRAAYLLGAEDNGLPRAVSDRCHHLVQLPGTTSLNVSVAGSIVLYDRITGNRFGH